ncbi:MAG: carboxypeptidase M32 [Candidatus Kapabacteria bacterium]|nr:carboxypeptidase M32 [Candidatus Kapabacteria bacterium]
MNTLEIRKQNSPLLQDVLKLMYIIRDIHNSASLLGWDQETYMPTGSVNARASQLVTLETIAHRLLTSKKARILAEKIEQYNGGSNSFEKGIYRTFLKEYNLAVKLPQKFVEKFTKARTYAIESWKKARQMNDYNIFEKDFDYLTKLKIEQANYYGFSENPYDALIDLYEPGMTYSFLLPYFEEIKEETRNILDDALRVSSLINDKFLYDYYDNDIQFTMARQICEKMGFDFYYGRLDKSIHPFTTSFSRKDVRLTVRVIERDLRSSIFSAIHEAGHGLYEQNISHEYYRTFLEEGSSYGIHESQSLLWEKIIARTLEFSNWFLPILKEYFPSLLKNVTSIDFFKAINKISKSFMRTEADELTYNLHIIMRFEIENDLLNQKIRVRDIPEIWNQKFYDYFSLRPVSLREGCLQDIHWAQGSFGYFPTYTLGKIYSAMIWKKLQEDIPDVLNNIENGNFILIKNWLRENIHQYGKLYEPQVLMKMITGKNFDVGDYNQYIRKKISMLSI